MQFDNPLNALLAGVFCLIVLTLVKLRYKSGISTGMGVLRTATLLAICIVLAEPYLISHSSRSRLPLLVDISDSVDVHDGEELLNRAKQLQVNGLELELIPFAGNTAQTTTGLYTSTTYEHLRKSWAKLNSGETNIASGLNQVNGYGISTAILISDGFENKGSSASVLQELQDRAISIFPLTLDRPAQTKGIEISYFDAPLITDAGKTVKVKITLKNHSADTEKAQVRLTQDGHQISLEEIEMAANSEKIFEYTSEPIHEGIHEIVSNVTPHNQDRISTDATAYISAKEGERILLLNGNAEDGRYINEALGQGFKRIDSFVSSTNLATTLSQYSAIILNNVPLNSLPNGFSNKVEEYVSGGGGLIMIGGDRSFGLGAYLDSNLEKVLPVKMLPPQTKLKRLNLAVELVMDKSRSMATSSRLDYAKEAARETIRNLKDDDMIGVIGFDSAPFEVVRLAPVGGMRDQAIERVGRLFPTGKTNLMPAMEEARRRLAAADAGRKHMIILTDGQLPDAGPYYVEMVKQLRLIGITVSTIMLGSESDLGLLRAMGDYGGGSFYQAEDPSSLPRIFLKDVKVASGEETMREKSEYPIQVGPDGIRSTTLNRFPPVRGFVQTLGKPDAKIELVTVETGKAFPILASWKFGEGKSLAFTSDSSGRWSNFWVSWPRFVEFWENLVKAAQANRSEQEQVKFDLRYAIEKNHLELLLSVYSESAAKDINAKVLAPDGAESEVSFVEEKRGLFRASLPQPISGKYELRIVGNKHKFTPIAIHVPGDLLGERKGLGFNRAFLRQLADVTGGKLNPSLEDLGRLAMDRVEKFDLRPYFFLLAALLFVLEVLTREVGAQMFRRLGLKRT